MPQSKFNRTPAATWVLFLLQNGTERMFPKDLNGLMKLRVKKIVGIDKSQVA
jgi:hypothetical protein